MDIEEIRRRVLEFRQAIVPRSMTDRFCGELLELLDADEEDPPADVDDGFVILPVPRYEALREAEEHLQETRFEPSGGEGPDGLSRRLEGQCRLVAELQQRLSRQAEEIGRLREGAKMRADAAAPLKPTLPRVADEVLLKHVQDLQSEIDGIKDRLDEGCGQFNGISAAIGDLRYGVKVTSDGLSSLGDRINAVAARVNKLDADVMPIRRIGPGTGPEAERQRRESLDEMVGGIEKAVEAKRAQAREGAPS